MSLLPIVLFVLGVVFLIGALRMGNSNTTSPEIIAILKGLAGVKRELSQVQKGLREVEAEMGDHELRLLRNENVQAELRSELQAQTQSSNLDDSNNPNNLNNSSNSSIYYSQTSHRPQLQPISQSTPQSTLTSTMTQGNYQKTQVLPEKYRWVLELNDQGWSVAEIAGHLAISRDAVNMVLRTSQKGGCA